MRQSSTQRLLLVGGGAALIAVTLVAIVWGLSRTDGVGLFIDPGDLNLAELDRERVYRVGGLVAPGTWEQTLDGKVEQRFVITDCVASVQVVYADLLPDLFQERQGAVATGKFGDDGVLYASKVLARHDEEYTPQEVKDALDGEDTASAQQGADGQQLARPGEYARLLASGCEDFPSPLGAI